MNLRRFLAGLLIASPLIAAVAVFGIANRVGGPSLLGQATSGCSVGDSAVTVYSLPTNSYPQHITRGPDGNFWFTMYGAAGYFSGKIGKITPAGVISTYPLRTADPTIHPYAITTSADGTIWFTINTEISNEENIIGKMTPTGVITEYPVDNPQSSMPLRGITPGPDGAMWVADYGRGSLRRVTTDGTITEVSLTTTSNAVNIADVVTGPDGNLWAPQYGPGKIDKVTPAGGVTEYRLPVVTSGPEYIVVGSDGNLWFTERSISKVGKMTPQGGLTEYQLFGGTPFDIVKGADGNIWIALVSSNSDPHALVRVTPSGAMTTYPLPQNILPNSLAAGSDGSIWFTNEQNTHKIVKFVPGACLQNGGGGSSVSSGGTSSGGTSSAGTASSGAAGSAPGICAACSNACADRIAAANPPKPSLLSRFWSAVTGSPLTAQVSGGAVYSVNNGNCTDADGGLNPLVAGETRDSAGGRRADTCADQFGVMEASCSATPNSPMNALTKVSCPVGTRCNSGACKPIPGWTPPTNPPCRESDGGADVSVAATTNGNKVQSDSCEGNNMVHEYFCAQATATSVVNAAMVTECPAGTSCKDGACTSGNDAADWACDKCLAEQCPAGDSCAPICGDGFAVAWEECDDGNTESGDGCSATCETEIICSQAQIDCFRDTLQTTGAISFGHTADGKTLMLVDEARDPVSIKAALHACNMQALAPDNFDDAAIREAMGAPRARNAPAAYVDNTCTPEKLAAFRAAGITVTDDADCSTAVLGYGNWTAGIQGAGAGEFFGISNKNFTEVLPCAVCEAMRTASSASSASSISSATSRLACQNNQCVVIAGGGQNQCATTPDCSNTKHLACTGVGACAEVPGPGTNLCTTGADCDEMHLTCVGLTCQGVPGYGPNACASAADCQPAGSSSSASSFAGCPTDACGLGGGKAFCSSQGKTCVNAAWPDCIRCDAGDQPYDCSTQDECAMGGTQYCASLGKTCTEIPDGLCIECTSDMACPANGCFNGGEEYCSALGKQCSPTAAPQCIECGPVPAPVCLGTECDAGGDQYCATFGKECKEVPSDLCIECVNPIDVVALSCAGDECARGGNGFCGIKGQTCVGAATNICIECTGGEDEGYACQGNECRFGGSDYCGSFGKGCTNVPSSDTCIACKATIGCRDSSECDFGSQCIGGSCVKTCGNGRIDSGEACDGGPGCTTSCLLALDQQCTFDTECQTGRCTDSLCETCSGGNQCQSGQCTAGTCLTLCGNGRLDPGEICDPGPAGGNATCTAHCLLAQGGECSRDADCQTGFCADGQCVGCSRGSQCDSGICVSGTCVDLCGNGRLELLEACDDGNRITGDGCSRFCELEGSGPVPSVASRLLPVNLMGGEQSGPGGANGEGGTEVQGIELPVGTLSANASGHAAAGETGPAALLAIAGGASAGWAWMRRRRKGKAF